MWDLLSLDFDLLIGLTAGLQNDGRVSLSRPAVLVERERSSLQHVMFGGTSGTQFPLCTGHIRECNVIL